MKTTPLIIFGLIVFLCASAFGAETDSIEDTYTIKSEKLSIDIEVDGGTIQVVPSNDRRDCRVLVSYMKNKTDVDLRFNQERGQLDISIDSDNWDFNDGDKAPKVILELPNGPELSLEAHLKAGEADFEIGDLNIADFQLRHWAGETRVNFQQPNRMKMRTFDINVKVGEVELLNLGNALFEEADINSGIGELTVDFNGEHVESAMARIDLDIGETTLILPESIGTKLKVSKFLFLSQIDYPNWFEKRGSYYYSDNYEDAAKSLYLMISTGIGELDIKID